MASSGTPELDLTGVGRERRKRQMEGHMDTQKAEACLCSLMENNNTSETRECLVFRAEQNGELRAYS